MTVMTYKRATGILEEAGFKVHETSENYIVINKELITGTVGIISKEIPYQLDTYRSAFDGLKENEQFLIANTLRKLMMTKLDQREEEQLYYVQFVEGDDESFLLRYLKNGELVISNFIYGDDYKIKFTKAEIMAINPNYMLFAVPVEDNND